MKSVIYQGEVSHARLAPLQHSFRYPAYFYAFDLDELPLLARQNPLFGYNQLRPVAIYDRDYLQPGAEPIRVKLAKVLQDAAINIEPARVVLVTAARYFNYVFNPISFFYCYSATDELLCVLTQVRNTFGEMHLYLLSKPESGAKADRLQYTTAKQFHVSPFFKRQGEYQFQLTGPDHDLDNQINYFLEGELMLVARLQGQSRPFTTHNLLGIILKFPLGASLTMPRILWQAAKLYWQRRLPVYDKPVPNQTMTVRAVPPTLLDRLGMLLCFKFLSRLPEGELQVTIPDGRSYVFGQPGSAPAMKMEIRENRFFRRAMFSGDIGFGEAYTDGDWTADDLPGLLRLLAANEAALDDRRIFTAKIGRGLNYLRHLLRANTLKGSSRNIREHYDLSNDFFATFLDKSMTYSAAIFPSKETSLAKAQRNKIATIIAKAGITSEDHVLEIGCGWGSFAIEAVRQTGCRLTGITLSHEQLALARERVKAAGLEGSIDLQLCDYRQVKGEYSKIVSIEMLEAVGHAGLKPFFATCERLLQPGGKAVIQVITIPDRKYTAYRYSSDWIRKHIFPGGHLPSVGVLAKEMAAGSRLIFGQLEHFGLDYARTLECWRETLLARRREIVRLGYNDNFLRKWDYYFSYCMAGFEARIIDLAQLVVEKPANAKEVQDDVSDEEQAA
ncbi:DUF1365 family protein [Geopsychrobacter electrodiphilus]|uniref:DUF1365 family protein n=1 Tax=Geopsychrobacter electrodiphilus TaxID=225196 RepID=UPI000368E77D|nr:DUF1365 family protein [Geopsychrobacter electrodiphilus]